MKMKYSKPLQKAYSLIDQFYENELTYLDPRSRALPQLTGYI